MTSWTDPDFEEAVTGAALIALGDVEVSTPQATRVRLVRVFAGAEPVGASVTIQRAAVVGRGHEGDLVPAGRFLFVAGAGPAGYRALTDTWWVFRMSDEERVHLPIRDPFTRVHVLLDELAQLVTLVRDPTRARTRFLLEQEVALERTAVDSREPIQVNAQVIGLEAFALLGDARSASVALRFLDSPYYQVRWSAARALATCWSPRVLPALIARLAREDVPPVQTTIAQALRGRISADDRPTLEPLRPRMHGQPVRLATSLMSPIDNSLPAPAAVLQAVLDDLTDRRPGSTIARRYPWPDHRVAWLLQYDGYGFTEVADRLRAVDPAADPAAIAPLLASLQALEVGFTGGEPARELRYLDLAQEEAAVALLERAHALFTACRRAARVALEGDPAWFALWLRCGLDHPYPYGPEVLARDPARVEAIDYTDHTRLADAALLELARFPGTVMLGLAGTALPAEAIERELPLRDLPRLRSLSLANLPLTYLPLRGADQSRIEHLDLSGTRIRNLAVELGGLPSLRVVDLRSVRVDPDDLAALRQRRPDLAIVR